MMNRNVLVTGASRGIGKAIAIKMAMNGYNVAINYNSSQDRALKTADMLLQQGLNVLAVKADVSKSDEVISMFSEIEQNMGSIDILINNAGISSFGLLSDLSEDEWDNVFDVNMKSAFLCSKQVIPNMVRNKWGKILNISSIWGISGASCEVCYSASKAAMIGYTKALAKELGPSNINVNCIAPGVIKTKMNKLLSDADLAAIEEETPLGCVGTPEDIAKCALYLVSDDSKFITGQVISPNGGIVI